MGVGGNKGATCIRMDIYDSSMCFINSHLAAHVGNSKVGGGGGGVVIGGLLLFVFVWFCAWAFSRVFPPCTWCEFTSESVLKY